MSPREPRARWEPSDGALVDRQGVPLALDDYPHVNSRERALYRFLCTQADRDGIVRDVSQKKLAARFEVDRRTLSRCNAALARLRMLVVELAGYKELAVYRLRPPSAWISERMTGLVSDAELEAHFGPAHRPGAALHDRRMSHHSGQGDGTA